MPFSSVFFFCLSFAIFIANGGFSQDLEQIGKQKPVRLNGGLTVLANSYQVSGIDPRSKPFLWSINGSPTLTLYGVSLPFYFNIGAQNRSFSQPFNQFGVSPTYKAITAHLGWRSMNFSQYTLGGIVMFGAGVELKPGKFRFAAMAGRFNKAVREDTTQQFIRPQPAYKRIGFSTKIGFGTDENFIDFIILKAKDDASSYEDAPERLRPAENAVFGINSKFLLFKHVQLGFEVAASAYTRNTLLDTLDDSDYDFLRIIMPPNISTQLLFAGNAHIGYTSKYFNLRLNYKRVDQDYNSMGAFIFQTDMESWTVEPSFSMFKSKVRISGSVGLQHDNLLKNKFATTDRTIGSVNLSFQPNPKYGLDVQYGNYGITQRAGIIPINDTTRLAIANQNLTIVNRVSKVNTVRAINVIALFMYQDLSSLNPFQSNQIGSNVLVGNLSGNYSLISTGLNFTAGVNYTKSSFQLGDAVLIGPTLGIGRSFMKKKLSTSFGASYMVNQFQGATTGSTVNGNVNFNYRISGKHSFLANMRFTHNGSTSPIAIPFTELWMSAGYQFTFF
jgi:hypothetical protein